MQLDEYVVVVSENNEIIHTLEYEQYVEYIGGNSHNFFNIPSDILTGRLTFSVLPNYVDEGEGKRWGWCVGCGLGVIGAALSGGMFGVLDVLMCVKCGQEIKKAEYVHFIYEPQLDIMVPSEKIIINMGEEHEVILVPGLEEEVGDYEYIGGSNKKIPIN